jgi:hypothetical protein
MMAKGLPSFTASMKGLIYTSLKALSLTSALTADLSCS